MKLTKMGILSWRKLVSTHILRWDKELGWQLFSYAPSSFYLSLSQKKRSMACSLNNDSNFTMVVWKLPKMKVMNLSVRPVIFNAVYHSLPFGQTGFCLFTRQVRALKLWRCYVLLCILLHCFSVSLITPSESISWTNLNRILWWCSSSLFIVVWT